MGTTPSRRQDCFCCARGIFYPYGWFPLNRAGAEPQTVNNLCWRWWNKPRTIYWITVSGFDRCNQVQLKLPIHYWEELSWRSWGMHYQNKPDPELRISELQNSLRWGKKEKKKKSFSFRQLYCCKRPQGLEMISDLAFNTGTQYLYPDPVA